MNNKIVITLSLIFAVVLISIASVIVTMVLLTSGDPGTVEAVSISEPAVETLENSITDHNTVICGQFNAPLAIAGVPVKLHNSSIEFQDGYVLVLDNSTSFFMDRYGVFTIFDKEVRQYAVVTSKDFDVCAAVKEAIEALNSAPVN